MAGQSGTIHLPSLTKKYIVRLTDSERAELTAVVKKLKGSSQKVRRAHVLLKADAGGPAWTGAGGPPTAGRCGVRAGGDWEPLPVQ